MDDLLRTMVKDDAHLSTLYAEYMATRLEQVGLYTVDPAKISVRMKQIKSGFYAPGKNQDRRLHNLIVRAAASLDNELSPQPAASNEGENRDYRDAGELSTENLHDAAGNDASAFVPELEDPEDFPASSEGKNQDYHPAGGKSRKGFRDSPMRTLNSNLHKAMLEDLGLKSSGLDTIAERLRDSEPITRYIDAPTAVKHRINQYIADFVHLDVNQKAFADEIRLRRRRKYKRYVDMPEDRLLSLLEKEFIEPDAYENKQLHETVLHFAQRLDQHRFVHEISSDFFSLLRKEAFENEAAGKRMLHLFEQLRQLNETTFRKLPANLQGEINSIVAELLKDLSVDESIASRLLHPDELTPMGLHNTVCRFAHNLNRYRVVNDHSSAFYSSLRDGAFVDGELKTTLQEINPQLAREASPDVPFKDLPGKTQEATNKAVKSLLQELKLPDEVIGWFVPPNENSIMSFHNQVRRFARHYYEHQFIHDKRDEFYHPLAASVKDENRSTGVYARLQEIRGRLAGYSAEARFDELDKNLKADVTRLAYDILMSNEDSASAGVQAVTVRRILLDEDMPKDLQNTVLHVARNLDEISRREGENQRRRKMSTAYHAARLCLMLAETLARMTEDKHQNFKREPGQSKLEQQRTFRNRKHERQENYVEYGQ